MQCPSCEQALHQAGRTYKCEACNGAWVRAEVLVPMLEQSASTLIELPWQPSSEDRVRHCPECQTSMQNVKLGTVLLDRCEQHGVWFDEHELAALLKQAKKFRAEDKHEHKGLFEHLAQIF